MGDRDGTIRVGADVGGAVDGLGKVKQSSDDVSDSLRKADGSASAWSASLTDAYDRVIRSAQKLADPDLSPVALQRTLLQTKINADALADAIAKVRASGGVVPPAAVAELQSLNAQMSAATVRSGELMQAKRALRTEAQLASGDIRGLAGQLGSLHGQLGLASASSSTLLSGLGSLGLGLLAVGAAAKETDRLTKEWGESYVKVAEKAAHAKNVLDALPIIQRAIAQGWIQDQHSNEANYAALQKYQQQVNHTIRTMEDLVPSLKHAETEGVNLHKALDILGTKIKQAGSDSGALNRVLVDLATKGFGATLHKAMQDGILDLSKYPQAVQSAVKEIIELGAQMGVVEKRILAATKQIGDHYASVADAAKKMADKSTAEWDAATRGEGKAIKELGAELDAGLITEAQYHERKRQLVRDTEKVFDAYAKTQMEAADATKKAQEDEMLAIQELAIKEGVEVAVITEIVKKHAEQQASIKLTGLSLDDLRIAVDEINKTHEDHKTKLDGVKTALNETGKALATSQKDVAAAGAIHKTTAGHVGTHAKATATLGTNAGEAKTPVVNLNGAADGAIKPNISAAQAVSAHAAGYVHLARTAGDAKEPVLAASHAADSAAKTNWAAATGFTAVADASSKAKTPVMEISHQEGEAAKQAQGLADKQKDAAEKARELDAGFTIGGAAAKKLGGGFKGAADGAGDLAKAHGAIVGTADGVAIKMDALGKDSGPVHKLGGAFKGVELPAGGAAKAIGEISNKTGDLVVKITAAGGGQGPIQRLGTTFSEVKTKGIDKSLEGFGEFEKGIDSLATKVDAAIRKINDLKDTFAGLKGGVPPTEGP